jgi:succinate--hydroxymethylglutarate CoA-transferase
LALDEVLASPQVAAREMVLDANDAAGRHYRLLGGAVHWPGEPPRRAVAPPELGQHTDEVLRDWLEYDEQTIRRLRDAKAID